MQNIWVKDSIRFSVYLALFSIFIAIVSRLLSIKTKPAVIDVDCLLIDAFAQTKFLMFK